MNIFKTAIQSFDEFSQQAKNEDITKTIDSLISSIEVAETYIEDALSKDPKFLQIKQDIYNGKKVSISILQREYSLSFPKAKLYYEFLGTETFITPEDK